MRYFQITHKRISEQANGLVIASDVYEARDYKVNECGVLTLRDDEGENIKSFPPGAWLDVEHVEKKSELAL